jgi:hypothetical protein
MMFVTAAHMFLFFTTCRDGLPMQIEILLEPRYPPTFTQSSGQARLPEVSQERKSFDDLGGRGVLEK